MWAKNMEYGFGGDHGWLDATLARRVASTDAWPRRQLEASTLAERGVTLESLHPPPRHLDASSTLQPEVQPRRVLDARLDAASTARRQGSGTDGLTELTG